jgi:hypothetical protein
MTVPQDSTGEAASIGGKEPTFSTAGSFSASTVLLPLAEVIRADPSPLLTMFSPVAVSV